jgi:hypothetical protein
LPEDLILLPWRISGNGGITRAWQASVAISIIEKTQNHPTKSPSSQFPIVFISDQHSANAEWSTYNRNLRSDLKGTAQNSFKAISSQFTISADTDKRC